PLCAPRVKDMTQHHAIACHRSADVAYEDQWPPFFLPLPRGNFQQLSAIAHVRADHPAEIGRRAASNNPPPRPAHARLPMQFVQHRSCLSQLVLAKLGEVFRPRDLAGTITHGCDALDNLGKRAHCRIVSSVTRLSRWEIDFRLAVPSALAESAQIRHG